MPFTPSTAWQVLTSASEPAASVRIQNLQTLTSAASDAWGRRNKTQPLHLTAHVVFSEPFPRAGTADQLGGDTVHYGNLSKAILAAAEQFSQPQSVTGEDDDNKGRCLAGLVGTVWGRITGHSVDGERRSFDCLLTADVLSQIRFMSLTAMLPKASLLGSGVSYTVSACFPERLYATLLRVHELRVPTLVGVNDNERLAKQFVVATVSVDTLGYQLKQDIYTDMERLVVRLMEESSFDTLEALGRHLADRVSESFLVGERKRVHVRLEKPTAVPLAKCPVVEIRINSEP